MILATGKWDKELGKYRVIVNLALTKPNKEPKPAMGPRKHRSRIRRI